ncbi:MAG TPA: FecR domain-containing protein, partial [Gammaproteobacteria bacterium]|nr:FecR domain-containing protein [Gammaproteobacteria bacterium]
MKTSVINPLILLSFLSMLLPGITFAANLAGQVEKVSGTAWGQLGDEPRRQLEQGSPFYVSDTLTTEAESTLELRFEDKTKFFVGPDAELAVEEFIYNSADRENSFSSRILKGTFRFVTGLIAREKPEDMEVNTSVATIGVRGTQVVGEAAATSATIILLEPEDKSRNSIIQVANQYG